MTTAMTIMMTKMMMIQELEQGETYKYVGIEESEHGQMKETLKKEHTRR
jgi:hypothetical protein